LTTLLVDFDQHPLQVTFPSTEATSDIKKEEIYQHPLQVTFPSTEATSDIKKEEISITRHSNENLAYNYDSYDSLKSQEANTFPTCFIITIGESMFLNSSAMSIVLTYCLARAQNIHGELLVDPYRM
jgi:hypothetical protein